MDVNKAVRESEWFKPLLVSATQPAEVSTKFLLHFKSDDSF